MTSPAPTQTWRITLARRDVNGEHLTRTVTGTALLWGDPLLIVSDSHGPVYQARSRKVIDFERIDDAAETA